MRPEGEGGPWGNRLQRKFEAEPGQDLGQHGEDLEDSEVFPDAKALPAAEREVGEPGTGSDGRGSETAGVVALWAGKVARVAVDDVLREVEVVAMFDRRAARQAVAIESHADEDPRGRVEAHGLVKDLPEIG